jgi:hypothetical protein
MFTLERQVRQVCNHALGASRVAGVARYSKLRLGSGAHGLFLMSISDLESSACIFVVRVLNLSSYDHRRS